MARKKDGSLRFCTDFRGLNSVTVRDAHPLPRVDAAIDQLSGSTFFSCLDLSSGYWQVEIDPRDREKTAFTVGRGLWHYKVVAMGLKNAPPTFQRLMALVLNGVDWQHVLVYIDDICLFSTIFEHHLALLREVFTKLRAANLKLKPSKFKLFKQVWHSWDMKCRPVGRDLIQPTLRRWLCGRHHRTRVNCAVSLVLRRIIGNSVPTLLLLLSHCNV